MISARHPARPGRLLRAAGCVLGLLAPAVLAGCGTSGPPTITVLSNGRSVTVPAQPACTMLKQGGCPPQAGEQRTIKAAGGSQIEVDVPAALAKAGWIATAYTTDGTTNTPLQNPGASTGTLTGQRTARLNVPTSDQGSYYLQIIALRPSRKLTNWLCLVEFGS